MSNRKLQVRNYVPIPICILQPSPCQIQFPLVSTTYEKKTNLHWTVNQTKETTQINNIINLLSTKTDLNLFMVCILQASQRQKMSCKIERTGKMKQVDIFFDPENKSIPCHYTPTNGSPLWQLRIHFLNPFASQFSK